MGIIKKSMLVAGLAASASIAQAIEVTANVTMASDYVFRGISQTNEKGAIQGGFDVGFENGAYAGTWASNVDFGDEVTTEMDYYVGYAFEVSEGVELDFTYIYFLYAGQESSLNYSEFVAAVSIADLGLSLVYSPDYFGSDESAIIYNADYSFSLSENTSLDLHVGYTDTDNAAFGTDDADFDSYMDYSVGVSHGIAGVTLGLAYVGSDADDDDEFGEIAEGRVLFSISKDM
jgi:uncharacterized protein (TIGR02001 family)